MPRRDRPITASRPTSVVAERGGGSTSATPSIALLNRKLGTSPASRMLTPSEIDLLKRCAREALEVAAEVVASKGSKPVSDGER